MPGIKCIALGLTTVPVIVNKNATYVDLSTNVLTTLDDALLFSKMTLLTDLDISDNMLSQLDASVFAGLSALNVLHLSGNALTTLDASVFAGLSALKELYLSGNALTTLDASVFAGLSALKELDLSSNALTELDASVFAGLSVVWNLDLANNALTELDASVFVGLKLQSLDLGSNSWTELDAHVFVGLTALRYLYLYNSDLTQLDAEVFAGLSALTELHLDNNNLVELDASVFDGLDVLDVLYLSNNRLTQLSAEMFAGLSALTFLTLEDNDLSELGNQTNHVFSGLSSLNSIHLSGNPLVKIGAASFVGLSVLPSLVLRDLELTQLDAQAFIGLSALKYLNLINNTLTQLGAEVFAGLSALTELDLNGNNLVELDASVFYGLSALGELNLWKNALTELNAPVFAGLSALTTLTLYNNDLTQLGAEVFAGLSMLTKLDLSFNKLTHLNAHVFAGLGMLRDLDLDGNNLAQLNIVLFVELSKLTDLDLSDNKLALLNASVFDGLDALKVLDLSNNKLTQLDAEVFGGMSALTELNVKSNRVIQLDPMLLLHLTNLATLDLSRNLLTKVDGATFRKFNGKSLALFLVDNNITQGDGTEAMGEEQEQGFLCQKLDAAVIIPPAFATLRSGKYALRGPKSLLAHSANQVLLGYTDHYWKWDHHFTGFFWSDQYIPANAGPSSVGPLSLQWDEGGGSANINWQPTPQADYYIVNPPSYLSGSDVALKTVPFMFTVTDRTGKQSTVQQTAQVTLVYSAFHRPHRFNTATSTVVDAVAGAGLQYGRVLRIKELVTASAGVDAALPGCGGGSMHGASTVDWLEINCTVEPNPSIPTSIRFQLISDTCNTDANGNANTLNILTVREVHNASTANQDAVIGWELVVGDPASMVSTEHGTLSPCTALLQATDATTGEHLTIVTINASVRDCFDNTSSSTDPKFLSCNGYGTCNTDPDPYDGNFLGCKCNRGRAGDRCEVKACPDNTKYITKYKECRGFFPDFSQTVRAPGRLDDSEYINPATLHQDFYVKDTIRIRPLRLISAMVSDGEINAITYKLASGFNPPGFFVSSDTGEILGHFDPNENSSRAQNITVILQAYDGSGLSAHVETMHFHVKPKPPEPRDIAVPTIIGCVVFLAGLVIVIQQVHQIHVAKKDAKAALVRALEAYGILSLDGNDRGLSVNSGDVVGMTTNNAAFVGIDAIDSDDVVLLLDPGGGGGGGGAGYNNDLFTYDDDGDDDDDNVKDDDEKKKQHREQLSKFVAPTISLGKSTLAAKGLDVLLGIDPKTYMHVKNKVKVMLNEFAKHGTDEDNKNLKALIDGTYINPPN
eukprot:gene11714-5512_t